MIVYVAMDTRNRWFEIYATVELAKRRADTLNTRYRTDRYMVSAVLVIEEDTTETNP